LFYIDFIPPDPDFSDRQFNNSSACILRIAETISATRCMAALNAVAIRPIG
jgi:hypothetical protein